MANLVPSFSFSVIPRNQHKYGTKCCFFHKSCIQRKQQNLISPFSQNPTSKLCATSRLSVEETQQQLTAFIKDQDLKRALSYLFRTEIGDGLVKVYVTKKEVRYFVYIEVSSFELGDGEREREKLVLCWGVYRADSSCFLHLGSSVMNLSPLVQISADKFAVELEFDAKQVPLYLSFFLRDGGSNGLEIRSHMKRNFCVPVGSLRGYPAPLGLSFSPDGSVNFAIFSRHAESVVLCLYDDSGVEKPALELDLDPYVNRSGDIWHISFESAWSFVSYGYRCRGPLLHDNSYAEHILLDPYAKIIGNSHPKGKGSVINLGRLGKEPSFEWGDDYHPNLSMEKLVGYRLNVKRFTQHESSQLPSDLAGTFSGLAKKVQHFKDLGVNAVLLEPVFTFDDKKGPYFPCHFFSPMHTYGPSGDPLSPITSMKEMVKTMHANGIEVLMEVVFSNTAEIGALHGIDDLSYYYANGVGDLKIQSSLNCNYPIVQNLILDSLRHWVTEFHIDGFSFINASYLLRGFHGEYLSRPPLVEAIAFDPVLSKTKFIADCWDPHDMVTKKETRFPHWMRWAEINTNFCNDVRNFLRGENLLSNLATRLCGSGDMFSDGRGPAFSFNYIAKNFGLSLVDVVSFSGVELAAELSWNCGEEGPTNNTTVLERRLKQIRNFLFILFVSLGVPVLNMGDECGQSSGGSPAYGDIKPFNWGALKTGFGKQTTQFIFFLSSLRNRRSDLLQSRSFLKEENIEWQGSDQAPPRWEDPSCKFLAMTLKAEKLEFPESSVSSDISGDLFIAINATDHPETVVLPLPPEGMSWFRLVDTALPFPGFFSTSGEFVSEKTPGLFTYQMKSYSCTLFESSNRSS
ncbi:isoamylase 2, chloroplastic [Gastrolobium bilobum]|uniref:isoamylase 2, chloroplastic n=1 Tax=Gastrolobium bilobum TaxID=150636 RepID=UPI002AB31636|nr:isoamylase 2, chloroplastic [Gastrolobium bilobum]